MSRLKLKNLKNIWGEYDFQTGHITIHSQLQKIPRPSKPAVRHHEEYHKFLVENGIKNLDNSIELKCEIYSLMMCRSTELTYLERYLKRQIIKKHGKLSKDQILKMDKFI